MRKSRYNGLGLSIVEEKAKLYHNHNGELKEVSLRKPKGYEQSSNFHFVIEPVKVEIKGKLKRDTRIETVLVDCLQLFQSDDRGDIEIITASLENFIIK